MRTYLLDFTGKENEEEIELKRNEIKRILQENEYGFIPPKPKSLTAEITGTDTRFCGGDGILSEITLTATTRDGKIIKIPFKYGRKTAPLPQKTIVMLNFSSDFPDKYLPAEEIVDLGWAIAAVNYREVTDDNGDFSDNAGVLRGSEPNAPGKIAIWAWAAMRIADYLCSLDTTDKNNLAVVGHSRLGKTALLAGAFDQRFSFVHSNDSGTCGAALFCESDSGAESIEAIAERFPYWFCDNFKKYKNKEQNLCFDQHHLISLIAPRTVCVASASEDSWANPVAEFRAAKAASPAWQAFGKDGLIAPDNFTVDKNYFSGNVGYYCRHGCHAFSRRDWLRLLEFFSSRLNHTAE